MSSGRCGRPSGRPHVASMTGAAQAAQALGEEGERIAERWLAQRGWRVVHRRYPDRAPGHRSRGRAGGVVAFVEVKARSGERFGDPVEAVNWQQAAELARSASVGWLTSWRGPTSRTDSTWLAYLDGGTSGAGPARGKCVHRRFQSVDQSARGFVVCSGVAKR